MKKIIKTPLRELSQNELHSVNGGIWGALAAIAIGIVINGCATNPKRRDKKDINGHNH